MYELLMYIKYFCSVKATYACTIDAIYLISFNVFLQV